MKITISWPKITLLYSFIGFVIYSRALLNEFVWDTIPQVTEYASVRNFDLYRILTSSAAFPQNHHVLSAYYKPIMYLIFTAIYSVWGAYTVPYHVAQLVVHIGNSVMVLYLLRRYMNDVRAVALSLVFLVHPINFEAAGYISAYQDTLFLFWGLVAIHIATATRPHIQPTLRFVTIGAAMLMSLLSKETGIACMGIVLLYSLMYERRRIFLTYCITSAVVLAIYAALRINSARDVYGYLLASPVMDLPLSARLLAVPAVITYYLQTFVFPIGLHIDQQWSVMRPGFLEFVIPLLLLIALCTGIYCAIISNKPLRTRYKHIVLFGLWLIGGLALHTNVVAPLDMTVADRWFYFPMVGLLALIGIIVPRIKSRTAVYVIACALAALAALTYIRSYDWSDKITLYETDSRRDPENYHLATMYAATLLTMDLPDQAEPVLRRAYKHNPNYPPLVNNFGTLYLKRGEYERAYQYFTQASKLPDNAETASAYTGMYHVQMNYIGNVPLANRIAHEAAARFPGVHQFHVDLAVTDYKLGKTREAIRELDGLYDRTGDYGVYRLRARMMRGEKL